TSRPPNPLIKLHFEFELAPHLCTKSHPKRGAGLRKVNVMRAEYDFSKAVKNPYAAQLKKQITIRLDEESINYFKSVSEDVGIPYQSLINLYLRDCASSNRKLNLKWE
ncbi:MAG: BrnA antitoxin family protein, partial [Propionivibrio sp.]